MNKSQLIDQMASSADISKAAAGRALDSIINSVSNALKEVKLPYIVPLELMSPSTSNSFDGVDVFIPTLSFAARYIC